MLSLNPPARLTRPRPPLRRVWVFLGALVLLALTSPPTRANSITVNSVSYPTIQAAITAASTGETVLVGDGTYTGAGNVDLDFGGKAITVASVNGAAATIIDCGGTASSQHRAFRFHTNETAGSVVRGFTIRNGYQNPGGAIIMLSSSGETSPTIDGCVFQTNTSPFSGGAIYVDTGSPIIRNCTFNGNVAGDGTDPNQFGGAIEILSNSSANNNAVSKVVIQSCAFTNNLATDDGGAVDVDGDSDTLLTVNVVNCSFYGNRANGTMSPNSSGSPGSLSFLFGTTNVVNSILYGDASAVEISTLDPPTTLNVQYSDVAGGYTGTGNKSADPKYTHTTAPYDLHLLAGSPAIDAGTSTTSLSGVTLPTTDHDGKNYDTPPSLGAFEVVPVAASQSGTTVVQTVPQTFTLTATDAHTAPAHTLTFSLVGTNGGAGHGTVALSGTDNATATYTPTLGYTGPDSFAFTASNGTNSSAPATVSVTIVKADTTTGLTISPTSPANYGQPVTFTATVAPVAPASGAPTSTVQFLDNGTTVVGTGTLGGGSPDTATFTTTVPLSVGPHSFTAQYGGDTSFNVSASSPAQSYTINKAPTTLTLALTTGTNPSNVGDSLTFTATLSGAVSPGGTITFTVDGTDQTPAATLAGSGTATFTTSALTAGPHSLTATYSGDANNTGAGPTSPALSQTVDSVPTVTSNPADETVTAGQTASFTASANGYPAPTVQWQVSTNGGASFTNVAGATSAPYTFTATVSQNGNEYRAVFTNTAGPATTSAATLTVLNPLLVTSTADPTGTAGTVTLRDAINYAEANPGSTITFDPTVFAAGSQHVITLVSALPTISQSTTITGPGAGVAAVDGSTAFRVFNVSSGTVGLSGLTIQKGNAGSGNNADGGGVYVTGGTVTLTGCTLTGNSANSGLGSGVYYGGTATLTLTGCTLTGNSTSNGSGGGVAINSGTLIMTGCTLTGNSAPSGEGGGLLNNGGMVTLTGCTLTQNSASSGYGGGVYNSNVGTMTLTDDILYNDTGGEVANGGGTLTATYCDIQGGHVGMGNVNSNPLLSALGSYGGPTQTFALLPGSPCLGAGTNAGLTQDQRGVPIPQNGRYDVGAFESQGFTLAVTGGTPQSATVNAAFANPLTATVTANDPNHLEPVVGGTVTFTAPASGAGATLATSPATIVSGGTASVTATANGTAGGPYTVTATTRADTSGAVSYSLTNTPGALDHFTITPSPLAATAGTAFPVTVTAYDAQGNVETGYSGPVTFSLGTTDAGATVNGTAFPQDVTATNGVATASVTLTKALTSQTLTATDKAGGTVTVSTTGPVSPGATTKFLVAAPNSVTAGQAFSVTVTAQDQYGNGTPAYLGTVHLTSSDLLAALPADHVFTASDAGAFTFGGVALRTPPSQTVTATDTAASSVTGTSGPITVSATSTTTSVATSGSPSVYGQSVTFTATLSGAVSPTGTVTFTVDNGTPQAATTQSFTATGGTATYVTSALSVSSGHVIRADYGGDVSNGSSFGTVTQVVNQAGTTTTLTGPMGVVAPGTPAAFTVTVAAVSPGAGSPSGTVQLFDGPTTGTAIATANVTSGSASPSATLSPGPHQITAIYLGDGTSFGGSTSNTVTVNVGIAPTVTTPPTNQTVPAGGTATFTAAASGNPTPTVQWQVSTNGGTSFTNVTGATSTSYVVSNATVSLSGNQYRAVFTNGVSPDATTNAATLTVNQATPSLSLALTTGTDPATAGDSLTFTATLTGADSPSGTVTFSVDGGVAQAATTTSFTATGGTSTYVTSALAAGPHTLTATYSGDANNAAAGPTSPALAQAVDAAPVVTANPSSQTVTVGQTASFTASASGYPTPTVQWQVSTNGGASFTNVSGATSSPYTFTTTAGQSGSVYRAVFSNTIPSGPATATTTPATLTVNKFTTSTGLTSSLNPSVAGQAVTFTATVTGAGGTPGGSVTFTVDGTAGQPVALVGGIATLQTSSLSVGGHTVTAAYGGDTNDQGSASALLTQTVYRAGAGVTLTSSLNPSFVGQSVTFTATVTGTSPTGTIAFSDGTSPLGSGTLSGGKATLKTAVLSVGRHTITAKYGGDTNNTVAASAGLTQTVTNTTVTVAGVSATYGQSVTLSAGLHGIGGIALTHRTLTFAVDGAVVGTATTDGTGAAILHVTLGTGYATGSHVITVTFAGDAVGATPYHAAASGRGTLTVTPAATSLTVPGVAAAQGQTATLRARLTRMPDRASLSGATLSFSVDGVPVGSAGTDGTGTATLGYAIRGGTPLGGHRITVSFGGSGGYAGSSGAGTLSVVQGGR